MDKIICPKCGRETKNIVSIKKMNPGRYAVDTERDFVVIGVGFKCEHCGHEWGYESDKIRIIK